MRRACDEGSSRCFRTSMNTCGDCPRRPARGGAPHGLSQEGSRWSSSMEGASSSGRSAALTCTGRKGLTPPGSGRSRVPLRRRGKASEGSHRRGDRRPTKPRRLPHPRQRARGWQSIDPKPASCRQARGRRRPDDREVVRRRGPVEVRRRPRAGDGLEVERWRVSHSARRAVSRGGVWHGCS
jgi:hypothetical protein